MKADPVGKPPILAKRQGARARMPPSAGRNALTRPRAGAVHHVMPGKIGHCALVGPKPTDSGKIIGDSGGDALASTDKPLEEFRGKCKSGTGASSPTFETVGGIANALTLGRVDQAVRVAKSYLENIKLNVAKYYWDLATDRVSSDQSEATVDLVPGPSLFDKPEQGISNLKVLRKGIEKELAVDEAYAKSNKLAGTQRKAHQRILNAHLIIGAIGTDEDLDRVLTYLEALRTEPQWPDFVKMLTVAVEEEAKVKFEAAQTRAIKLGGVQKLTRDDIVGLSYEQIKQLRGY